MMPYDPARYIPDYSWIARAGQDIGGLVETLGKIPEAVEMDKALQEHRVTNEDMYRDMRSYAKNIPTEVLDRMGTSRQDLGATMPKAFRKEVPVAYAKRLSEWVSPIVRSMVQAGLSADEIKQFGFSMPSQVGIGAAPGVEKAAAEARTREVEQFGQKQIAPGVTPDVSVPIGAEPQPAQPGGPVPARPEITLFGGEEVRPEASTRRELLTQAGAIGISPEQMKKTGAYQGMPPEQKPMTEYQRISLEVRRKAEERRSTAGDIAAERIKLAFYKEAMTDARYRDKAMDDLRTERKNLRLKISTLKGKLAEANKPGATTNEYGEPSGPDHAKVASLEDMISNLKDLVGEYGEAMGAKLAPRTGGPVKFERGMSGQVQRAGEGAIGGGAAGGATTRVGRFNVTAR